MMSLDMIHELSREAGDAAERIGKEPVVFSQKQLDRAKAGNIEEIRHIPNLGTHLPKGWARVRLSKEHGVYTGDNDGYGAFFVDSSGFGNPGEPALSLGEFIDKLKPGLGYAIVEEGQFQVKVGAFAVITKH